MNRTRASSPNKTLWYNSSNLALNRVLPSFVHDYINEKYYNTVDGETSFPFTATRTTNAMQFDRQGRLIWAPHQLCTRGNTFTSSWDMGVDGNNALSGNIGPTGLPSYITTWTTASPGAGCTLGGQATVVGATSTFSIYMRYVNNTWARIVLASNNNTANQSRCWVNLQTKTLGTVSASFATDTSASVQDVGNGWIRVSISCNALWFNATDALIVYATALADNNTTRVGNGAAIEVTSALLEQKSEVTPSPWRSEFDTTGTSWYGPRFGYDPLTGEPLGILIEESRTNNCSNGLGLTTSHISGQSSSIATAPSSYLGGWSAVRVTGDGTTNAHIGFTGSIIPGASTSRSIQAIIKPVTGTLFQLTGSGNWLVDLNGYANFNCSGAGSVTATGSSASNAFIIPLKDGCYHIGVTVTTSAAPTGGALVIIGMIATGTDTRLPANNSTNSFDFIYACNSLGVGWSSIVPTFGTAATKAADTLSLTTGSWMNASKGTLYMVSHRLYGTSTITHQPVSISDNTLNNRVQTQVSGSVGMVQRSGGVNYDYSGSTGVASVGSSWKIAVKYSTLGARYTANGGAVPSSGTAVAPASITTMWVGANAVGTQTSSFVKEIRYYPDDSATDAQLQSLTT